MQGEYVEKLKAFSKKVNGEFKFTNHPTTTLKKMGWSRVEIRIPCLKTDIHYIAFSGTNSAEIHSGFHAEGSHCSGISCKITQKDKFSDMLRVFSKSKMKSGKPSLDNKLSISCSDKQFLLKLTGNYEAANFLKSNIRLPMEFTVMSNEKTILKEARKSSAIISLRTNEWMVEEKQLMTLLDGFKNIVTVIA